MKIEVNGHTREISAATLSDALDELGFAGLKCATAVNTQFVPASARVGMPLNEGDRLEVLTPMQGG